MRKNKVVPNIIYILTEGQTEVAYFHRISEIINADTSGKYFVKVEVRDIEDGVSQDPKGLVEEASRARREKLYSEVWVVFDRDRDNPDQIIKAYDIAKKSKVNIAYSSISFEHWLILHFEKKTKAFQRSDCNSRGEICECNGITCASTYLKENFYLKFRKGYSAVYDDVRTHQDKAIENSSWLRQYQSPFTDIWSLNPYTDVDFLVCKLFDIPFIRHVSLNETFNHGDIELTIRKIVKNNINIEISLEIMNGSSKSLPMNLNQPFEIIDDKKNRFGYSITSSQIINPGVPINVDLTFRVNQDSQSLVFNVFTPKQTFFFEIP